MASLQAQLLCIVECYVLSLYFEVGANLISPPPFSSLPPGGTGFDTNSPTFFIFLQESSALSAIVEAVDIDS